MGIMHPNRAKMIDIALDVLPFDPREPLRAIDLGVGTGYFAARFLLSFPRATVLAIDGAASMIDLARVRLGENVERATFVVADLGDLPEDIAGPSSVDVVFSSYTLHHLDPQEKRRLIYQSFGFLRPHGWFVNADLVVAEDELVEARIQELRVTGIVERASDGDPRFGDPTSARRFLDDLETTEQDQPVTLTEDLRIIKEAGLAGVEVFWKEYREVVIGGLKTASAREGRE
jgi:ubiquinone/menaquinone biosynthesis C-methylase UbiE